MQLILLTAVGLIIDIYHNGMTCGGIYSHFLCCFQLELIAGDSVGYDPW